METLGANFILFTILLTTTASVVYFIVISYSITQMDPRYFVRKANALDISAHNKLIRSKIQASKASGDNSTENPHLTAINRSKIYLLNIIKIIAGLCLLVLGLLMLVLPGQGLITMLIGLSLLPFPGKAKMEQNLLARKSVRSTLNWIRRKANKSPFIFD
jgi:hypothetical protein